MNTANKITVLRIFLVPFFVTQVLYYLDNGDERFRYFAIAAFALAAISDGIDGYVARRFNQRTELGMILDPVADKLLLVSGLLILTWQVEPFFDRIPLWCTAVIVSRDVLLILGVGVVHYVTGNVKIEARLVGKVATLFQMTLVLWTLLKWPSLWQTVWAWLAAAFTGISAFYYFVDGMGQLGESSSGQPPESA